jgi:hypothetical protein
MGINSLKNIKMKYSVLITMLLILSYFGFSQTRQANTPALDIVNQRMYFYNHHNFEKFINLYSDSIKVYTYPEKLLATGKDNLTSIFQPKFSAKSIRVKIVNQISNGDYVINQEIVTENGTDTKYVSIYEVKNDLITSVKFLRDN